MVAMSLVQQLREYALASGKTQVELERETGISQPALSRFLAGNRGLRLPDIDKLAAYFKLELRPAFPDVQVLKDRRERPVDVAAKKASEKRSKKPAKKSKPGK